MGKRPCGRPKKRWLDVVEKNLKKNKIKINRRNKIHDREKWGEVVISAKTLVE